ncbi:MAG: TonB family protein [Hyphomonadaceae bacterium]
MAQTLGLRATSFMASAALLGLLVVGAVSVKITLDALPMLAPPIIPTVIERPDPPKPPPIVREQPPEAPVQQQPFETLASVNPEQPLTQTLLPFSPPAGPPEITTPRWLRRPANLAAYYPQRAVGRSMEGEVVLDCRVLTTGDLNCTVASETPENWGFGQAALRIARDHRMAPAMRDGVPVEGRYRMRVPFELR